MNLKPWNKDIKQLRSIILKEDKIEESKNLCLSLHAMVHSSIMSGIDKETFEDELLKGLDENTFKIATNEKGRTIAYGIWHSTRIEDITMNILVAGDKQIFNIENWKEKINSKIIDTGNAMIEEEIIEFSKNINIQELKNYRIAVGRKTRKIIKSLTYADMKRKFKKDRLQRIVEEGAVLDVEGANWLIDFWGRKNVAGIILMPATRHHVIHINESLRAKKKSRINKY
ncbi:DinB family protein [Crassaminicella profunda]|uniref:DinB family protein n=1 Tax=Crassaminicella profunda TaxID=1286698 RepID=UPI001CA6F805|nr:DinB family protein [Crassaminicella profunda]QZY53772.1 DinB family protein [Crassaminicella profunda]